jgi:hypothetical protein
MLSTFSIKLVKYDTDEGKEKYFFHLNIGVSHAPIPTSISKSFGNEIAELVPHKVNFNVEDEFKGFEIVSQWAAYTTEYIIGVAAYLSGDIAFSSELHLSLYRELKNIKAAPPAVHKLRMLNTIRTVESLNMKARLIYYANCGKDSSKKYLEQIFQLLEIIKEIKPDHYPARIMRAIVYFLLHDDHDKALHELNLIKNSTDITHHYSLAFLYAYKGDRIGR